MAKKMETDVKSEFCEFCGGHTMVKVAVTVQNGIVTYKQSNRQVYAKRGTKYSLPKPTGGRNANTLLLCEDQLMMGHV